MSPATFNFPILNFLYHVKDITFESAETCESCLEFLVDRLDSESTHVKLKVRKFKKKSYGLILSTCRCIFDTSFADGI